MGTVLWGLLPRTLCLPPGTWPPASWKMQGHSPCKLSAASQPEPGALICIPLGIFHSPSQWHSPFTGLPILHPLLDSWPLRVRTACGSDLGKVLQSQHCTRYKEALGFTPKVKEVPIGATVGLAPRAFELPSNVAS